MSNLNLIDDYLANRMTDAEKSAFETRLANEPELKQEYSFHKEIVNSIQLERKAELKSMLNNMPVAPNSGFSTGSSMKIAASVITGAILLGGIFYFTHTDDTTISEERTSVEENIIADTADKEIKEKSADTVEPIQKDITVEKKEQPVVSDASNSQKQSKNPEIKSPNLIDDFETEEGNNLEMAAPEVYTETSDISAEQLFNSQIEVITDNSKKKYQFHYQYQDDKLYLYGNFDKGLYEILEFNSNQGKTIILYYKDGYYLIDTDVKKITPLKAIEDSSMVEKLNNLRRK